MGERRNGYTSKIQKDAEGKEDTEVIREFLTDRR